MRTIVFLCLLAACSVTIAQDTTAVTESGNSANASNSQDTKAATSKDLSIKIFNLKYAKASQAQETLSQLDVEGKITADSRLNALVVQATREAHEKIAEILETVDSPQQLDTTEIIRSSVDSKSSGQLVQQFAKISGVEVAFDEELGIFMIKGPQAEVERVRAVIDRLGDFKADMSAKTGTVQNRALRVLWLSNEPTEDSRNRIEPDAALKKSIEKLAQLGYADMQVKMQLLGRCDIIEGKATCKVEGALLSGNIRRTMNAEANFSYPEAEGILNGKFHITAGAAVVASGSGRGGGLGANNEPDQASVEVAIKLEPKKYYILSASPVGGFQTAFVVQLVDGL